MTKRIAIAVVISLVFVTALCVHRNHKYPFGRSHCCDKQLWLTLLNYADMNDGRFPAGEDSPEASLSLLYEFEPGIADVLRGKSIPQSIVIERLENGQLLTPDTCGWHYVEGLHKDDDPNLALFWDKKGLDHHGGIIKDAYRNVCLIGGPRQIADDEWDAFLVEQDRLMRSKQFAND